MELRGNPHSFIGRKSGAEHRRQAHLFFPSFPRKGRNGGKNEANLPHFLSPPLEGIGGVLADDTLVSLSQVK
ncbi:hypothetical protein CHS0354_033359 [Potamilus streckersoni]|uniref:Uncharacterized protein n=1 Tax=Potamilus streckersoni TaxID=2493646 RepID=A0AAE0RU01_9BIVA|nr:hypothetical protein CHS0354_033359 [Potamilus streckersoni]